MADKTLAEVALDELLDAAEGYASASPIHAPLLREMARRLSVAEVAKGERLSEINMSDLHAAVVDGGEAAVAAMAQVADAAHRDLADMATRIEALGHRVWELAEADPQVLRAGPQGDNGFLLDVSGRTVALVAGHLAAWLEAHGAENYTETAFDFGHHETPFTVTVQRRNGRTPHQLRRAAEAERDAALAELDALRRSVAGQTAGVEIDATLVAPLRDLVACFASALLAKMLAAEAKHGWQGGWAKDNWRDDLVRDLARHVDKGDPRDVAAYCAFAWHHGWSIASPEGATSTTEIARLSDLVQSAYFEGSDDAERGEAGNWPCSDSFRKLCPQ